MHHIPTAKIEAAILAVIQRVSWYVRHNEKEFTERVREASDQNQKKTVKKWREKQKATKLPKPPKKKSIKELMELKKTGAEFNRRKQNGLQNTAGKSRTA